MKTIRRIIICGLDLLAFASYLAICYYYIKGNFQVSGIFGVLMGALQGIRFLVKDIDEIKEGR